MPVVSISIPQIMEDEIEAIVRRGYYDNKSEIFRDGIRELFTNNPNLRISAVVELYEQGKISLGKAAEIAGLSIEEMKKIFASQRIHIERGPSNKVELKKEVSRIKKRMAK